MVNDASCHQIAVGGYCKRIEDWTSIDTFTRQLDLCGVAPGVSCIVAVDPSTHPAMGSIATLAASRLGADAAMVSLPVLLPLNSKSALIADIAEAADFLVDLTDGEEFTSRANAREQCRALIAAGITPERLRRLRPHVGLSRRVLRAADPKPCGCNPLMAQPFPSISPVQKSRATHRFPLWSRRLLTGQTAAFP